MKTTHPARCQTTARARPPLIPTRAPKEFWGCSAPHNSITCMQIRGNYHKWLPTAPCGKKEGKMHNVPSSRRAWLLSNSEKSNIPTLLLMFSANGQKLISSHQSPMSHPRGTEQGNPAPRDLGKCHWKKAPRQRDLSETSKT